MDTPLTSEQIAEACQKLDPRIEWRNPQRVPAACVPYGYRLRTAEEYNLLKEESCLSAECRGQYWAIGDKDWAQCTDDFHLTSNDTYLVPLNTHPLPPYEVEKLSVKALRFCDKKIDIGPLDTPEKPAVTGTDRRRAALKEVEGCVCRDRQNSYGDAEDNFSQTAVIWTVQLSRKLRPGVSLDASDVAALMIGLKLARTAANPGHRDNWIDAAGYAVCGAGIQQKAAEDAAAKATYATGN